MSSWLGSGRREAPSGERFPSLDILRGVAIFGLIWVNAQGWSTTLTNADRVSSWIMFVFAAGKFWTLFSILFGISLAIQSERAGAEAKGFTGRWLWRMAVLFGIGWVNAILFWPGDILREYAIAGAALLLFRRASQRVVAVAAVLMLLIVANGQGSSELVARVVGRKDPGGFLTKAQAGAMMSESLKRLEDARQRGSYVDNVRARAGHAKGYLARSSGLAGPLNLVSHAYFALFLVGLYVGRKRIVQDVSGHLTWIRTVAVAGLLIGIPVSVYIQTPSWAPAWLGTAIPGTGATYGSVFGVASRYLLAGGYACSLLLLLARERWRGRLSWLAPVGRLGLTNYVVQGACVATLNDAYGFGLSGRLGSFAWTLIAIGIFGVQVAYSNWWISRFRHGPLEWLWRTLAYRQPLGTLRAAAAPSVYP